MTLSRILPLTILLCASPALAHPGHHDDASLVDAVSHLASSPFHLGIIALVLTAAIGLGLIWRKSRMQAERQRSSNR